jgi:hypothetical protein
MDKKLGIIGAVLALVLLLTFFAGCGDEVVKRPDPPSREMGMVDYAGYCGDPDYGNDPSSQSVAVSLGGNVTGESRVIEATFTLTWTEDPADAHAPEDTFTMTVGNETVTGNSNKLVLELKDDFSSSELDEGTVFDNPGLGSSFSVDVSISECGFDPLGPLGLIIYPDRGNSYSLTVEYVYYAMSGSVEL